mmetsp:Transcript_23351/g.40713  ORF Transcript_23351/g.40713 Transcript_23351/m.40713 type:complete len:279 (-) Transcript_23351:229-1065(-)
MERRHTLGPNDALVVMAGLNDRPQKAAHPNAMAAHVNRRRLAIGALHCSFQRLGILGAKVKDLAHFDPSRHAAAIFGDGIEQRLVMGLVGAGIEVGEFVHNAGALRHIVIVDVPVTKGKVSHSAVIKHLALACLGQNQEFMSVIATNGATVGTHRNGLQTHPLVRAQVADQMTVVGMHRILFGQIKVIPVLHQEFATAHHTKTRADFVAEFPLDLVHGQGQVLVAAHMRAKDIGDQLFGRGREQHIAVMAVFDPQHFGTISVIAATFTPQVCRLNGRH